MTILIVEDEPKVHDLLRPHFEGKGYKVLGTETGEGALELIQRHQPDVVLLDLSLKGKVNGVGVLKAYRQVSSKTKVIVITGLDEPPKEEVFQLGACAFLKKPIRLEDLEQLLAQLGEQTAKCP